MTINEFVNLSYGNIIQRADGKKFYVVRTNRNPDGTCKAVALAPAIEASDTDNYTLIANDRGETILTGRTIQGE